MPTCSSCAQAVPANARSCPACGAALIDSQTPTRHLPASPPADQPPNSKQRPDRFIAGAMLAGRYRIVSSLGKGGMGEVYQAEDLKLNQTVALKFLPAALALDGGALARFHNEVRIARQVSHPNVCRVYDIGEVEGLHFITMEFIAGEDLGALLKKVGRLPGDKAVELARQLCAGLTAAHEQGVLHRDLKPANVMIDGRGRARITDFGLAVVAEELRGDDVMAGTPAYMAPEQLTGKEVTQRSDIYALGLVLYELFTGKRVFEAQSINELLALHEKSTPPTPSSHVKDIDPLAERVILRCLEKDPKARPASAVQVALALPGGDPLAAALAMGETPSPEMVAAAGEKTGLRPQLAVACLVAVIIGLLLITFLNSKVYLASKLALENSPDVLAHKAREIISRIGYTARPADTAYGFNYDGDYLQYTRDTGAPATRNSRLLKGHPPVIQFWYRESPGYLEANFKPSATREETPFGRVTLNEPPQVISGMASTVLDPQGRLIAFSAVPPQLDPPSATQRELKADWTALFAAAGLDEQRFMPAEPEWVPLVACDVRAAWTGGWPEQPEMPLRIEAAAWRGRPVWFQMIGPWTKPERMPTVQPTKAQRFVSSLGVALIASVMLVAMLLAWRNNRQGRGDRRGAFRLACFVFAVQMLAWLLGASHVPTTHEINGLFLAIGRALFTGVLVWLTYLALEPYLRRHWPQPLIAWGRCLEGRFNDPLVGRDILIGLLFAIGYELFFLFTFWLNSSLSAAKNPATILGLRYTVAFLAMGIVSSVTTALGTLFLVFLFRAFLRRLWLAAGVVILVSILSGIAAASQWIGILMSITLYTTVMVLVLLRFGLISAAVLWLARTELLIRLPLTTNFSVWYAGSSILGMVALLMLAGYAFHTSLGGQKVFTGKLLDE